MANRRRDPVGYRPFRAEPLLAEGLLAVSRPGGEAAAETSSALFRMARVFGERAEAERNRRDALAGSQAGLAGAPSIDVSGGYAPGPAAGRAPDRMARSMPGEIRKIISDAALRHGVDPNALLTTAMLESGGDPNARNPRSSAGGLFQQIDSNAAAYGVADRFDAYQSADGAARFMKDNAAHLTRVLGRPPTAGELYLAHQQGPAGAERLLSDPGGDAVATVGREAVLDNGGLPGMTNAEFANLWIRKAGERGSSAPARATVSGGGFRPTGNRAFDVAAARSYLGALDTELTDTQAQLFEKYRDDPEGLARAMADLKSVMLRDHVFPEIAPDFSESFDRNANRYGALARDNLRKRGEQAAEAAFIERGERLSTELARQAENIDPDAPGAAEQLASGLAAVDRHFDDAVARDIMTADAAASARAQARSDTATMFYQRQAQKLDAEGVRAMHEKMRADFSAGTLDGVDGAAWTKLDGQLTALEEQKRVDQAQAANALASQGAAFAERAAGGFSVDPVEFGKFLRDSSKADGGAEIVAATEAMIEAAGVIRDKEPAEAREHVKKMREALGETPDAASIAAVGWAEEKLKQAETLQLTDPAGWEVSTGRLKIEPIDVSSQAALERSLTLRRDQMAAVGVKYRMPYVSPFRPGEAPALGAGLLEKPDALVEFSRAVGKVFGKDASRVLGEIAPEAPPLAHAAGLFLATGDDSVARDMARTLAARKEGLYKKKMPSEGEIANAAGLALGSALSSLPRVRSDAISAATLLFEGAANSQGFDPSEIDEEGSVAEREFRTALERALGGNVLNGQKRGGIDAVNGFPIVAPHDFAQDEPERVLHALTGEQLQKLPPIQSPNGFPVTAEELRQARLVTAGDGLYWVALGDPDGLDPRWVMSSTGHWTLNLRDLRLLQPPPDPLAPMVGR